MIPEFGHYEIVSELGRGGMGIVYQALDKREQRMVAIKHLVLENIDPSKHREFRDRFRREAATAARLDHPNIVTVYDVSGSSSDENFYVMEFLEGHSLRQELVRRGGRMAPGEYLAIITQVAEGLAYAHSLNLVHRDVKPDNIFILKDGRVKLTDFGIARTVDYEQTHLTKTGVMLGTLAYVSPEQLQDAKNVDHRADIFSLGVVSYEALAGRLPFTGEGIAQTVIKILSSEPESVHILAPTVPVEVAAVVSKALRKKARDRYMSVTDFLRDYERAVKGRKTSLTADEFATDPGTAPLPTAAKTPWQARVYTPGIPIDEAIGEASAGASGRITPVSDEHPKGPSSQLATRVSSTPSAYYLVKPIAVVGRPGEDKGCFMEPTVVCARSNRIAVADTATRRVQVLSRDGRWLFNCVAKPEAKNSRTGGGSLTTPSGVAIDFRGRIIVADSGDHYIRIFDSQGHFMKELLNINGRDGGVQGIVIDSAGLLYVSDADNGCLQVFQYEMGTWLRKVGMKGVKPGQIQLPSGVAVDRANQVYVVDYGTSRISVFNKAGMFVRSFGGKGTANGLFNVPRGIAVDRHDRIYVSDSLNHRIQIFGPAGDWLYSFGGRGGEFGKFVAPAGLCIDSDTNCLYVADRGNRRIQVFELCEN